MPSDGKSESASIASDDAFVPFVAFTEHESEQFGVMD